MDIADARAIRTIALEKCDCPAGRDVGDRMRGIPIARLPAAGRLLGRRSGGPVGTTRIVKALVSEMRFGVGAGGREDVRVTDELGLVIGSS
jgi:hypothetical protein